MTHPKNKKERLIAGETKAEPAFNTYYSSLGTPDDNPGKFGVLRDTRKLCSNPFCCGNPRRVRGRKVKTLQERKSDTSISEEFDE